MSQYRQPGLRATEVHTRLLNKAVDEGLLLGAPSRSDLWDALDAVDDVTLDALDAAFDETDRVQATAGNFFVMLLLETEWTSGRELRDALLVAGTLAPMIGDLDADSTFRLAQGLKAYGIFGTRVPGELHGRDRAVAQALIRLTWLAYSPYEEIYVHGPVRLPVATRSAPHPGWYLTDPALVAFIAGHTERIEEIIAAVRERRTAELDTLAALLASPTAVGSGIL